MHDAPQEAFSVIRDLEFVKRGDHSIAGDMLSKMQKWARGTAARP